jgi:hypothetical protein
MNLWDSLCASHSNKSSTLRVCGTRFVAHREIPGNGRVTMGGVCFRETETFIILYSLCCKSFNEYIYALKPATSVTRDFYVL